MDGKITKELNYKIRINEELKNVHEEAVCHEHGKMNLTRMEI